MTQCCENGPASPGYACADLNIFSFFLFLCSPFYVLVFLHDAFLPFCFACKFLSRQGVFSPFVQSFIGRLSCLSVLAPLLLSLCFFLLLLLLLLFCFSNLETVN